MWIAEAGVMFIMYIPYQGHVGVPAHMPLDRLNARINESMKSKLSEHFE